MIVDNSPVDRAFADFIDAIDKLPAAEQAAQRLKFLTILDECPGRLFFGRWELAPGTGPTYDIERSTLHPSEVYLNWIAALRAGNVDWDIEQTD